MRYQDDCSSNIPQLIHPMHAAVLKNKISNCKCLVHKQNVRIHVYCHRERQTHEHPAGIGLDRLVHETADLGKCGHFFETQLHFFSIQA